jgi:hypothetical protein
LTGQIRRSSTSFSRPTWAEASAPLSTSRCSRAQAPNGQTFGLRAVTGITANAYTDASPTQAEFWPVLAKTVADVGTALGAPANVIVMHPRRYAWVINWKDSATGMQSNIQWPVPQVAQAAAIRIEAEALESRAILKPPKAKM